MSFPRWPLSSGISSSTGRSVTRVLLHSRSVVVLENTTFGSAFMSWPVALCELGHAFAMSWAARRPSTSVPVWPSSSATAR